MPLPDPVPISADDVKLWRSAMDLTQERLARALGVSVGTIAQWESGRSFTPPYLRLALERLEQLEVKRADPD